MAFCKEKFDVGNLFSNLLYSNPILHCSNPAVVAEAVSAKSVTPCFKGEQHHAQTHLFGL